MEIDNFVIGIIDHPELQEGNDEFIEIDILNNKTFKKYLSMININTLRSIPNLYRNNKSIINMMNWAFENKNNSKYKIKINDPYLILDFIHRGYLSDIKFRIIVKQKEESEVARLERVLLRTNNELQEMKNKYEELKLKIKVEEIDITNMMIDFNAITFDDYKKYIKGEEKNDLIEYVDVLHLTNGIDGNKDLLEDLGLIQINTSYSVSNNIKMRPIILNVSYNNITIDGHIYCKEVFVKLPHTYKICALPHVKKMSSKWLLYMFIMDNKGCGRGSHMLTLRCKVHTDGSYLLLTIYDIVGSVNIKGKQTVEKFININKLRERLNHSSDNNTCSHFTYFSNELEYSLNTSAIKKKNYCNDNYDLIHFELDNIILKPEKKIIRI